MIDFDLLIDECDTIIPSILDNIGVEYIRESGWICMRCCFHDGDNFNLKYRNKSFYCFSECRESYSIIDVVAKILDIKVYEASIWISETFNISCDKKESSEVDLSAIQSKKLLESYKKIKKKGNVEYKPVPQVVMNDIEPCYCKYIQDWGISRETAEEFGLGFARGGELDSRIIFPIDAPDGTIISLSGRLPNAEDIGLKRYHILNESDVDTTLYNISRAKEYAKELGYIFVVEGFKSVLSLYQWGYKNVVAVVGASLGAEQAKILLKLGVDVYVVGDNDKAGKQMMQSVYNRLYKYLDIKMINISDVSDKEKTSPDDLGKKKFEELLTINGLIDDDLDF